MRHWAEIPFVEAVDSTQHRTEEDGLCVPRIPFFGRSQVGHCVRRLDKGRDGGEVDVEGREDDGRFVSLSMEKRGLITETEFIFRSMPTGRISVAPVSHTDFSFLVPSWPLAPQ